MATEALAADGALTRLVQGLTTGISGAVRTGWGWSRLGRAYLRLLAFDGRCGLEELVDVVVHDEFFRTKQVPSELVELGQILEGLRPKSAMEIGTWKGGTLFLLSRLANPRATIVSVDLPGMQPDGGGYSNRRAWLYRHFARRGQRLCTLRGDSHSSEMLSKIKAKLRGQPLDYLFIDGDHTYKGVQQDFEMYAPLIRKGGVVAFHDIAEHPPETFCEVSRFWGEIKSRYRHIEFIADPRQGWAGVGVLYVD